MSSRRLKDPEQPDLDQQQSYLKPKDGNGQGELPNNAYASVEKYCGDNAPVWKRYMSRAEHDDRELAQILNDDLESLLLFVGKHY
jgi:hypothetical protein